METYRKKLEKRSDNKMINIALPKGRLGDKTIERITAGIPDLDIGDYGRNLTMEFPSLGMRFFLVKPWDVPIYVESGVADIGISGRDTILERQVGVYELLDLDIGICKMAVAGYPETRLAGRIRVATKYPVIAREHYSKKGIDANIIKLNGSVELAPILGLSDVIVDIVESGKTLRANGLVVLEDIFPVSARLIANKSSCKFKRKEIDRLVDVLAAKPNVREEAI